MLMDYSRRHKVKNNSDPRQAPSLNLHPIIVLNKLCLRGYNKKPVTSTTPYIVVVMRRPPVTSSPLYIVLIRTPAVTDPES